MYGLASSLTLKLKENWRLSEADQMKILSQFSQPSSRAASLMSTKSTRREEEMEVTKHVVNFQNSKVNKFQIPSIISLI